MQNEIVKDVLFYCEGCCFCFRSMHLSMPPNLGLLGRFVQSLQLDREY